MVEVLAVMGLILIAELWSRVRATEKKLRQMEQNTANDSGEGVDTGELSNLECRELCGCRSYRSLEIRRLRNTAGGSISAIIFALPATCREPSAENRASGGCVLSRHTELSPFP